MLLDARQLRHLRGRFLVAHIDAIAVFLFQDAVRVVGAFAAVNKDNHIAYKIVLLSVILFFQYEKLPISNNPTDHPTFCFFSSKKSKIEKQKNLYFFRKKA